MSKLDVSKGEAVVFFIAVVVLTIPLSLLNAFVVSTLWRWFVLPVFPGVAEIGVWEALGLIYVVDVFRGYRKTPKDPETKVETMDDAWATAGGLICARAVFSLTAWLFGWVVYAVFL